MNKKELCKYVRTLSQELYDKGEGTGCFCDLTDSEIYIEFGDMTLEEITSDVTNVERNILRLITADAIAAYRTYGKVSTEP